MQSARNKSSALSKMWQAVQLAPGDSRGCTQVLFHTCQQRALEEGFLRKGVQPCKVAIRLVNCPHAATHIRQLRSSSVGKPWLSVVLPAPHRRVSAGLSFFNAEAAPHPACPGRLSLSPDIHHCNTHCSAASFHSAQRGAASVCRTLRTHATTASGCVLPHYSGAIYSTADMHPMQSKGGISILFIADEQTGAPGSLTGQLKCTGRLVSIRGTVLRVSGIRPLVLQIDFACSKCGTTMTCPFPDGKFTPPQVGHWARKACMDADEAATVSAVSACVRKWPTADSKHLSQHVHMLPAVLQRCDGEGCRSRAFEPMRSTAVAVDFQKLRIQACFH